MTESLELMVDSILALLLVGAIAACWIVSRRLTIIREGQKDLHELVDALNQAVVGAEGSVEIMNDAAHKASQDLDFQMQRARGLSDELSLMTASADNLANRLEASVAGKGQTLKPPSPKDVEEQQEIYDALKEAR